MSVTEKSMAGVVRKLPDKYNRIAIFHAVLSSPLVDSILVPCRKLIEIQVA